MTLRLSGRVSGVPTSGTMAADERMRALRATGRDIVSLGAGQSRHYGRTFAGRTISGSTDLAAHLLEHAGVAVVPGVVFGDDRCLRISFAASPEELTAALCRLAGALA